PADEAPMSRQYAPRAVLRQLPLSLIRDFLAHERVGTTRFGPDWDSLVEGDVQSLYQAWLALPDETRDWFEQMLREVHEMGTPAGVRAVIGEAVHRGLDVASRLEAIDG